MSMPTSAMAATAAGLIWSAGSDPAERTSTASPARCRSQPAAIWERPALCTQTNRTLGLSLTKGSSWVVGSAGRGDGEVVLDDHLVGRYAGVWVERREQPNADRQADQLSDDEAGQRGRGDPGEGVGEGAADRDGRVGEA